MRESENSTPMTLSLDKTVEFEMLQYLTVRKYDLDFTQGTVRNETVQNVVEKQ